MRFEKGDQRLTEGVHRGTPPTRRRAREPESSSAANDLGHDGMQVGDFGSIEQESDTEPRKRAFAGAAEIIRRQRGLHRIRASTAEWPLGGISVGSRP